MTLIDFPSNTLLHKKLLDSARRLLSELGETNTSTKNHCSRVIFLCNEMGKRCGFSEVDLQNLRIAACLHDIGKLGIDQSIIRKPASLNKQETRQVRRHPQIGADLILQINAGEYREISDAVRHHHENFNGSGYPDKLKGEEIPYPSRVISIIDCYDAISEHRYYHRARLKSEALAIMEREYEKGKFDPYFYSKFIALVTRRAA